MNNRRKIMFLLRKAPHGTIYTHEGLEAILIFCAYDQEITVVFLDDAVLALKKGQDTSELGTKNFSTSFRVLYDYGVERVCVSRESLKQRGLRKEDLILDVDILPDSELNSLMETQDIILPF